MIFIINFIILYHNNMIMNLNNYILEEFKILPIVNNDRIIQ